ncbi:MAG: AraC family transcriptional regulator [Solirubrobacteraceae bacterium]|nr:AraC family transcriptional regulator [Solirubrobacteraceae bacterium]
MHTPSSNPSGGVDRLTGLLRRFEVEVAFLDAVDPLARPRHYGTSGPGSGAGHLHVLSRGVADVATDGAAPVRITGPSVLLLPRALPHRIAPVDAPAVTCASLRFADGDAHPLVRAFPPSLVVATADVPGIAPTLDLLRGEIERVRCGQPLVAGRLLEVVLLQLLRWAFDHPDRAGVERGLVRGMADPGVAAALTALHDDPAQPWTLQRMARVAAMSRSGFAERFRSLVGETPASYLAGYRIALAQRRLLRGEPLATIAAEVGYANGSGLSRAFTARTGRSPSAWRADAAVTGRPVGGAAP